MVRSSPTDAPAAGEPRLFPAGDADYEQIGVGYRKYRRPDPRIAAPIWAALGGAEPVLNVGAGAGSYEPTDRRVSAIEPSAAMRAQRPSGLTTAIDALAGDLPFQEDSFEAAMAILTVHQWPDAAAGLREMRRVTRGPVVVVTCDLDRLRRFWLYDYVPELFAVETRRFPAIPDIIAALGGWATTQTVPIPIDCSDGFLEAYYGRPEAFLDIDARRACSSWSLVDPRVIERFEREFGRDLADGRWDANRGRLRARPTYDGSITIISA